MTRSSTRFRHHLRLVVVAAMTIVATLPSPVSASASQATVTGDTGGTGALTSTTTPTATTVKLTVVTSSVSQPVLATSPRDGTNRLFIIEKAGTIRIVKDGSLLATPFLDLSASVSKGPEQGLLGLAFHPGYKTNRKLYVNYTDRSGNTVVREFRASTTNPDRVAGGTGRTIIRIAQPYANHNGGMIAFGRDGYLYIGTGDGGSGGDPGNRAQSTSTLLGKMLRINVNARTSTRNYTIPSSNPYVGRTGRDEIWQRGLRNPWRFSFDRSNGNLWIGDVGQNKYEEVDRGVRTTTGPGRGRNWGWRVMEAFHCYNPATGCSTTGRALPLLEYSHASNGRCAVTGGYVYRGTAIPELAGWYVYGDYCSGEVWAVPGTASSKPTPVRLLGPGSGRLIAGFGQDDAGELYLCDLNGTVYRIDAA
jgi:glucose/arabinose dehydrogenase